MIMTTEFILRLFLAGIMGAIIGLDREYRAKEAGYRTHFLVSLGSALIMIVSQHGFSEILDTPNVNLDPSRIASQVVTGIGFIGAGTIIVTKGNRVKGLTTAAGLWTAAIIGLALGCGFYEGAIFTTFAILLAELLFSKWEYRLMNAAPEINLYMEYTDGRCLEKVLRLYREQEVKVLDMQITRSTGSDEHHACAIFSLRLNKKIRTEALLVGVKSTEGVLALEEL